MSDSERDEEATASASGSGSAPESREVKMAALRKRMAEASKANRSELLQEGARAQSSARDAARLEKQRKLAELLREKADADDKGEDLDRKKNWAYTIEENDAWEKKLARKERRSDFEFHDALSTAHRKYKKDVDLLKPNVEAYTRQKEVALGLEPGSLKGTPSASQIAHIAAQSAGEQAVELLYRDGNTLLYADNKPSEQAIDRVVDKLASDKDKRKKFSRKRANDDSGDVTYINERNRVFNKKIARYYDKYTEEIRASFERGTAL